VSVAPWITPERLSFHAWTAATVLHRLAIRLICYDRPGYGHFDRHEIANTLHINGFSVVGRSGSAPQPPTSPPWPTWHRTRPRS
jgi:hypothetical protein